MTSRPGNLTNTFWNMLDTMIYPVSFLAFTPFFLHHLGEKMFGVYMLSTSIVFSLQILNLGLGTATLRNVARFLKTGDYKGVNETINTNFSFSLILFSICMVAGFIILLLVRYQGLFNIENNLKGYVSLCLFIASLTGGLRFFEQIVQFTYKGFERFDIAAWFNLPVRVGSLVINFFLVKSGHSVMTMLLVNLLVTLTILILQIGFLPVVMSAYRFGFHFNKATIRNELNFGMWIWLQSLILIITYQTDRYVVTYIGLDVLSYYGLTATIFNHMHMILGSLLPWFFPRVAGMREKSEDVIPLFKTAQAAMASLGIVAVTIFYLVRQPLLTLWVGPEKFALLDGYLPLFCCFELFFVLTIVPVSFFNASGREKMSFYMNLVLAVFTIAAIFTGYFITGSAKGVMWGLITGAALFMPVMQYYIYRVTDSKKFIRDVVFTMLPSIFGLLLIITNNGVVKLIFFAGILISLRFAYFTKDNFNIKWLKH